MLQESRGEHARTVGELGESALIDLLREHLPLDAREVLVGIGDDAAVLSGTGRATVATVDAALEGEDFLDVWPCGYVTTGADVGYKSAAQNLSDVNAMGAVATSALLVLALTPSTPAAWVSGFARGFARACVELGAPRLAVVGGDLSKGRLVLASVSMSGELEGQALLRSGATPGDALYLAGEPLGRADVSLGLLASGDEANAVGQWGDPERRVARALFEPRPPLALGPTLVGQATAAMDVSDGLVRDASRLAAASGVALDLDDDALEREVAALTSWGGRHVTRGLDHVLYGGEDHLLLFTGRADLEARAMPGVRRVGTVSAGSGVRLGSRELNPAAGFDHFA